MLTSLKLECDDPALQAEIETAYETFQQHLQETLLEFDKAHAP